MVFARLLAYWMAIFATCWTLAFVYFCNAENAFRRFDSASDQVRITSYAYVKNKIALPKLFFCLNQIFFAIKDEKVLEWAT